MEYMVGLVFGARDGVGGVEMVWRGVVVVGWLVVRYVLMEVWVWRLRMFCFLVW